MDIDNELKQTLEQLLKLCRDFGIQPRLIGGLAVRGFARRKRYTHDIDLASSRFDKPNLVTILKQMGFDYQDQSQFEGVKASKRIGNTLETPLVCKACGQTFLPHFYCPEVNSSSRHIFAASRLYVDNMGAIYTFCPDHTFTTYALAADSKPRPKRSPFQSIMRFFDSIVFRLSLSIEGLRWRLVSRR